MLDEIIRLLSLKLSILTRIKNSDASFYNFLD